MQQSEGKVLITVYKNARRLLKVFLKHQPISIKDLKRFINVRNIPIEETTGYLFDKGFLHIDPNYAVMRNLLKDPTLSVEYPLSVTVQGKAALEADVESRHYRTLNEIRAWVTLAISVIALILSIISLTVR